MFSRNPWLRLRAFCTQSTIRRTKHIGRSFKPRLEELEDRCVPATLYLVNSLADVDLGGSSTSGTLRHVINLANANHTGTAGDPDLIQFTTGGGTISVNAVNGGGLALAANEVAVLGAATATGYAGTPIITLDGTIAGVGANGLTISGGSSTVKGFDIVNFSGSGVRLDTNGQDTVLSTYIGITTAGAAAANHGDGILVVGTSGNVIGSTTAIGSSSGLGGNVISGNVLTGIHLLGNGLTLTNNNLIEGNTIGTNAAGTAAVGNGAQGVVISDASANTVGGSVAGARNVISGNGGDGVFVTGPTSLNNLIVANYIGADATGSLALGNAGNGIQVANGARLNTIGGNTPTTPAFTGKPADGNVISGNGLNGVLLTTGAGFNTLSGNFIGTDLAGAHALGNALDGVAILNGANNNSLIGTTLLQPPFVFLNLVSGNGGNGLRINNADTTTVQANCFGLGDDNMTAIPNHLDGVLIEGSSANTQFGGVIPLGNISAGNLKNGVEITDTANGTVCFNTFCGLPAFSLTPVGNALDGFLITSTGGNNLLRTNVISGNFANGVHITGSATGVQAAENIIGMNTSGQGSMPNGADGILIDGNTHNNLIGGTQVSVILQNTISSNGANGIAIVGNANNNQVFHSFIGTDITGVASFGNAGAGIFIGGNAQDNTIGGTGLFDQNVISGNLGGVQLSGASQRTTVVGNLIGSDRNGKKALGNQGNGIGIVSSNNQIGGTAAGTGNIVAFNTQNAVLVDAGINNGIQGNSVFSNASSGIVLIDGGNLNQLAPVLTAAYSPAFDAVQVSGTLTAAANTTYTVEFFASPSGAPGQGQTLLGSLTVTTAANGFVPFVFTSSLPANAGSVVTATATDPNNNTSALSAPLTLGGNANNLFVASTYGLLLDRAPDSGAAYWVNALNSGASSNSVVLRIEASAEYLADQVFALYSRYLNRAPGALGEQSWLNALQQGATLEQVAEGIVSSPEYFQDHGDTNEGYILGLYNQVLDRTPSAGELDGWFSALNAGESRMAVAACFLTSTEYRTDLVESDYNLYLGRPADSSGLAGWVSVLQAGGTDQAVLAGIFGSPEGFGKWS
jgi:Domain of unknown function (DUF4214)